MAAEIVNLNRYRKAREKAEKRSQGTANAARFGRSGAEKTREKTETEAFLRHLDAHRRDRSDGKPERDD